MTVIVLVVGVVVMAVFLLFGVGKGVEGVFVCVCVLAADSII